MTKLTPSVYSNQRRRLTPEDLDNHPRAKAYIDYYDHINHPLPFTDWLLREQQKDKPLYSRSTIQKIMLDPYCRSPLRPRRFS